MRRYTAGSSCSKCTGTLREFAQGVLVCSRNGTHFFEANGIPDRKPKPKSGTKPVRTVVVK